MPRKDYDGLINKVIELTEDSEGETDAGKMFSKLLCNYFFEEEYAESKKFQGFLSDFEPPSFLNGVGSIFDTDMDQLKNYINGEMANDSLCGRIMMSKPYLSAFYPDSPPDFNSLPDELKDELFQKIKDTNGKIIYAFEKMLSDLNKDKNRKILTMVAMILKSVHYKTELPFNKLAQPAEAIIRSVFNNPDDVFTAKEVQVRDLGDDTKIKQLIKTFFKIKAFSEIAEIAGLYREELESYKKRTIFAMGR